MNCGRDDFITQYLQYTLQTEPPAIYHRWSIITALAAYLERSYYFQLGHSNIYPNIYVMLIGGAGTRKNTAINIAKSILRKAGYRTIAASKTSKEKFFLDLAEQNSSGDLIDDILDQNLFGDQSNPVEVTPCYIASGEFNTFFGNNILDFLSDLGELWDYEGVFESKIKNGKSIQIPNPTITMIGGNTPATLAQTFPPQIIGQGFFSRLLMIWGYKTREKITFPEDPDPEYTDMLVQFLKNTKPQMQVRVEMTPTAKKLLDVIYKSAGFIADPRFESYYNRRFSQLIKLCILCMVAAAKEKIDEDVVTYANTILVHAEQFMPKALGEFGLAKNSDVTHKVLSIIYDSYDPITLKDIWRVVNQDLENISKLGEILRNLAEADKIQAIPGIGFLPKLRAIEDSANKYVDYSLLTDEEKGMKV
jgi:hypothetical protein